MTEEKALAKISIPYNFEPREYQLPVLRALDKGYRRAVCVWHRRSGKDKVFLNHMVREMFTRVGNYYYIFPTYKQGKKVIWDGRDRNGFKFTDHIPQQLRIRTDNSEMLIEVIKPKSLMTEDEKIRHAAGEKIKGSIFQVIGSDNIDSIVGANPVGLIFSEWSLQDPAAWDYLRPILAENGGWAIFNYTPRGENHGLTTLETARKYPDLWYSEVLTVDDTKAIPHEVLNQERLEIIAKDGNDALYMQEYMCDFTVPIQGAYYHEHLVKAKKEGRITKVPHDPAALVHTAWDLGADTMKVWFFQVIGREIRFIDYMEGIQGGMIEYIKKIREKSEYQYGMHFAPHDIEATEITTGKTRFQVAQKLGFIFTVVPQIGVDNGIDAVRSILPRCYFDEEKCANGLSALKSYHKEWDDKLKTFRPIPKHDWASHGSDAFRMFAVGWKDEYSSAIGAQPQQSVSMQGIEVTEVEIDPYE